MSQPVKLSDRKKKWFLERSELRDRRSNSREEIEGFLIVCEGEKTEPNYFKGFKNVLPRHAIQLEIHGAGMNTRSLVDKALELREKAERIDRPLDQVWVVFDRDSFQPDNFDNAISKAKANGIKCAWSNEAFELWYVLHFEHRTTAMARQEYQQKLTGFLGHEYKKNDPNMYQKTCKTSSNAISRSRGLYENAQQPWSRANPCTTVFELVQELNRFVQP